MTKGLGYFGQHFCQRKEHCSYCQSRLWFTWWSMWPLWGPRIPYPQMVPQRLYYPWGVCIVLDEFSANDYRYQGGRELQDLTTYVSNKSGTRVHFVNVVNWFWWIGAKGSVPRKVTHVVDLTPANFDKVVKDAKKDVLVEFYAPVSINPSLLYSANMRCSGVDTARD